MMKHKIFFTFSNGKNLPLISLLCIVCSAGLFAQNTKKYYFPARGEVWQSKKLSDYKLDETKIKEAITFAETHEYKGSKDLRQAILQGFEQEPYHQILGPTRKRGGPAGMILKDGFVIAQWGDIKRVDMTFSVTKSFLSTIAGLALEEGLIRSVQDKVEEYVWDGTFESPHNAKITWEHLLQQSSDWSGQLWGGDDWADRPPREGNLDDWKNRKLHEPGTVFEYNDIRVNLLAYSLLQVYRKPLPQIIKEKVMDPIGASSGWRWYGYDNSWVNMDGVHTQSVSGGGHSGGGLFISAEDMARFGLLFLNKGKWKDQTIISEKWIQEATKPSTPNPNYGYMWWLNQPGKQQWENVPESVYYAAGFGGNYIVIDPIHDLVLVTRWLEPDQIETMIKMVLEAW
ncbi:MAG: serine hydrolase [Microscillaceae bacterium]|nr:serine hydrolase [Microscillaceae bacterium]